MAPQLPRRQLLVGLAVLFCFALFSAPAAAQGPYTVTGTITNASGGAGIANVNVVLLSTSTGSQVFQSPPSQANGSYTISNVTAGSYYIKTSNSAGYIDQIVAASGNISCVGCVVQNFGTVTTPGAPQTIDANRTVNFALSAGGRISGTISKPGVSAPSAQLSGINVQVYTSTGVQISGFTQTNTSGEFTVGPGLSGGNYYIKTSNVSGFIDAVYKTGVANSAVNCLSCTVTTTGSPVAVTVPDTTPNVNFTLTAGGAISGRVTRSSNGSGVGNVSVNFYNSAGSQVGNTQSISQGDLSTIGTYSSFGLPAGDYFVATTNNSASLVNEVYNDVAIPGSNPTASFITGNGTPVTVTVGSTTPNINFVLAAGATISGTITRAENDSPVQGISLTVTDASNNFIRSASTSSSGAYSVGGLAAGTYYIKTTNGRTVGGYIDQAYSGVVCAGDSCNPAQLGATQLTLATGETRSGINFALVVGGRISGTVTLDGTSTGVANITVQAYSATTQGGPIASANTGSDGTYTITGLNSGDYAVKTSNQLGYLDKLYNDIPCISCNQTAGDAVSVQTGSTTSGINFSLVAGGRITGAVTTAATGTGVGNIQVAFYNSFGSQIGSTQTSNQIATLGQYTSPGLPSGTYFVVTTGSNSAGLINELFDNLPCLGCTNTVFGRPSGVLNGTPVAVVAGSTTSGVNLALSPGGRISGSVTNTATGQLVMNAGVGVFTAAGGTSSIANAQTGSAFSPTPGVYTTSGLPPGTYYLKTQTANGPNVSGLIDEVYTVDGGVVCTSACNASEFGTAIVIEGTSTTTGINFTLGPGGTISGTVTNAAGTPLGGVQLQAFNALSSNPNSSVAQANTAGNGTYTLSGLPTGSYYVKTSASLQSGYINEVYPDITCVNCSVTIGTAVAVVVGTPRSGIDFSLTSGGTITGTIRNAATGAPLPGVNVSLWTAAINNAGGGQSDASGVFTVAGLPAGTYYARTSNSLGYIDKIYNDIVCQTCWGSAANGTPISVQVGATASGIDFSLQLGGKITGQVTNASTGGPVSGINVGIYNAVGQQLTSGQTNDAGVYATQSGLPTGTYYAKTFSTSSTGSGYINKLYNDIQCVNCPASSGNGIAVTAGSTTQGINFALAPGGRVTGVITNSDAAGVQGVTVNVYTAQADAQTRQPVFVGSGFSGPGGVYAVTGLPAGSFVAKTTNGQGYIDEIYDDVKCATCPVTTGKTFDVAVGETTSGIDFSLGSGARITGTVTNASTGAPIPNVNIGIYNASNSQVGSTSTNQAGVYVTGGLVPGTYFVKTTYTQGNVPQVYNNLPCSPCQPASGTPVAVSGTETVSNINFALSSGASIAGTVTGAGGAGLGGIQVSVFDQSNAYMQIAGTQTAGDGSYRISGLAAGTYYVKTNNFQGLVDKMYDNVNCLFCSLIGGTAITLDATSAVTGINFTLNTGGSISGAVMDNPEAGPLANVTVQVIGATGQPLRNTTTDGLGNYTLSGLTDGTYYVRTQNSLGYIDKLYNDVVCAMCNPVLGTPVKIASGSNVTGINFNLPRGGQISGTVRTASGEPLGNVGVSVFGASGGSPLANGYTAPNGAYRTSGLPTGSYYVKTNNNLGFIDQLYDGKQCTQCNPVSGTAVSVTIGQNTTGIDFSLTPGGRISGTITSAANGSALPDVSVEFSTAANVRVASGRSDGTGTFITFGGLPSGTYYAKTSNSSGFVDKIYDNIACASCPPNIGKPITVTVGSTTTGVNFSLSSGSRISGTVIDAASQKPIPNARVEIYASTGFFVTSANAGSSGKYITNAGLDAGTYYARAFSGQGHISKMYNDIECPACSPLKGTPIVVGANETKNDINFSLQLGGLISGSIRDAVTGSPIGATESTFLSVMIYNANNLIVSSARVDPAGRYTTSSGLPTGTYYARTRNNQGFINKLYDNNVCLGESGGGKAGGGILAPSCLPNTGTPISVTIGQTTTDIDFSLSLGLRLGGKVIDSTTGLPLSGADVGFFDANGKNVSGGRTDDGGNYLSYDGLPPGTYYAIASGFNLGYYPKLYDDLMCLACNPAQGTPIAAPASRSDINFSLTLGGSVAGSVTSLDTGQGLGNVKMVFYSSTGSQLGYGYTDASGGFFAKGIPPGTYFARTFNLLGYIDESYQDHACAPCPITDATPIVITSSGQATAVDFVLATGGLVTGSVTDATTGAPLQGVTVAFYQQDGTTFVGRSAPSDENGYYAISLPIGTYIVRPDPVQGYTPVASPSSPRSSRSRAGEGVVTVTSGGASTVEFPLESCSAPTVSPATLDVLSVGVAYSRTFSASGSNGPYTFSVSDGSLPPGLSLDAATGVLSGTPTTRGTANFTVAASGSNSCAGTSTYAQVTRGVSLNATDTIVSAEAGSSTVGVTAESSEVSWSATSNASWITIASGAGTGSGTVTYVVAANTGAARTGTITISGETFTVTQSGPSRARMSLDSPRDGDAVSRSFHVAGWAVDLNASSGVGVDAVHIYAYPIVNGALGSPTFLGQGSTATRADVGAAFGDQFAASGFVANISSVPAGSYRLVVYARSSVTGTFNASQSADITVAVPEASPAMALDGPASGDTVGASFVVAGWAVDRGASSGTGVDAVHVWAFPITSGGFGSPTFVGAAALGGSRPDVGSVFGSQFENSGFWLEGSGLSAGNYRIAAYAHSALTGTYSQSAFADVVVDVPIPNPVMHIDGPASGTTQSQPFLLGGWAADVGARSGTGIDAVHVWAFNVATGASTFVGAASYGGTRGDVAAAFGDQFSATGFNISVADLPAGTYDIGVYPRSSVSGTFSQVSFVRVTVQ